MEKASIILIKNLCLHLSLYVCTFFNIGVQSFTYLVAGLCQEIKRVLSYTLMTHFREGIDPLRH